MVVALQRPTYSRAKLRILIQGKISDIEKMNRFCPGSLLTLKRTYEPLNGIESGQLIS